jgi:hypothetical protein
VCILRVTSSGTSTEKTLPEFKVSFFNIFKKDGRNERSRPGPGARKMGFRPLKVGAQLGFSLGTPLWDSRWEEPLPSGQRCPQPRPPLPAHPLPRPPPPPLPRPRARSDFSSHLVPFPFLRGPSRQRSAPAAPSARPASPRRPLPSPAHLPGGESQRRLPPAAGPQQRRRLQLQPRIPRPRRGPAARPVPPPRRPRALTERQGRGPGAAGGDEDCGRAVTAPSFPPLRLPVRAAPREGARRTRGGRREGPAGS